MAESSCYLIANSLMAKIYSFVIDEASIDIGLYDDLQAFKESLLFIRDWLWHFDFEEEHLYSMRFFVREIKQVLHDAENMVDEFECERLRNEVVNAHVNQGSSLLLNF
ncbi:unnamed protein product [Lupinus luteus]|uniref:Disease resistance N-terminal domain-containing protein n=1 Tax=Lupinus luteus TaxID=3873 RepID=A0AAV1WG86_LUPLU